MANLPMKGVMLIVLGALSFLVSAEDLEIKFCKNEKFIECVGSTKQACTTSFENANNVCIKIYPIYDDVSEDKREELMAKYSQCYMEKFISGMNISLNEFERCGDYLKPTYEEYKNDVIKERKYNSIKLRKIEEIQYK